MSNILIACFKLLAIVACVVLICLYIYHRRVTAVYWSKRKVQHVKPKFLLGSLWKANIFESFTDAVTKIHRENKEKKFVGLWNFHKPVLMIIDIDLIRRMLISDFNNFRDRGIQIDEQLDPLAGHLFFLSGKRWRNLRVKLTPTFSSGKMKMMFPTMLKCGEELRDYLKEPAERKEVIELKDIFARFTTDVIGTCAFGIETNTLKNPKSEFREYGKKIFSPSTPQLIRNILLILFPSIRKIVKMRFVSKDVSDFFINVVDETIQYREKTQIVRNDFLQLLIQLMRAGKIEDVDRTPVDHLDDEEIVRKFSLHEAAAQCFAFLVAGSETSPATMTFALYELALNPDIQTRLHDEIDAMLESSGGEMTYEKVMGSEYLDMVIQETLRKYPPFGSLQRQCAKEYNIPELNLTIDKGIVIVIAVNGIHMDPEIYPDPDKFDPERFSSEEKSKRDPCTFLPFGEGPRNCIGNRFALMQVKIGLVSVLRDYNVEVTKETQIPVVYETRSIVLSAKGGMKLAFTKRR